MKANESKDGLDIRDLARRRFMAVTGAYLSLAFPRLSQAHGVGIVDPPVALPTDISVLCNDGTRTSLHVLIRGRRTLLQTMFTGCSEVCPLQGALFAALQEKFDHAASPKNQLLSLSIDPMDDARSLSAWLARFGAHQQWRAVVPSARHIDSIRASLQSGSPSLRDHSSQVYFIDEPGRLIWRSEDFPSLETVVAIAQRNNWLR